jgi:hypothetical protein
MPGYLGERVGVAVHVVVDDLLQAGRDEELVETIVRVPGSRRPFGQLCEVQEQVER